EPPRSRGEGAVGARDPEDLHAARADGRRDRVRRARDRRLHRRPVEEGHGQGDEGGDRALQGAGGREEDPGNRRAAIAVNRYARQLALPEFGAEGQRRLGEGSVAIVGAGGLGSPAAIYLAAAGVGRVGLIDFDDVDETNLHRQVLYGTKDIGASKLDAARAHLQDLNPDINIETHDTALSSDNALE